MKSQSRFWMLGALLCALVIQVEAPAAVPNVPRLSFSSFVGGGTRGYRLDYGQGIAVDAAGSAHITGSTDSENFPFTKTFGTWQGGSRGFATKFSPAGDQIVYSVALPGSYAQKIALDPQGNAYWVGYTADRQFPAVNAAQPELGGNHDAFVAKLSSDGSQLLYATFLGGGDLDLGTDIVVDAAGNAWVSGLTTSTNFPVTDRALQRTIGGSYDAFAVKLDPAGRKIFATYLGGSRFESGASLAVGPDGTVYVAGTTLSTNFLSASAPRWLGKPEAKRDGKKAYVAKLSPDGTEVQYLSLLGGSGDEWGVAMAVDPTGQACVFGLTDSTDFPATPNCWQPVKKGPDRSTDIDRAGEHFVAKLNPAGTALVYATYLGGSEAENARESIYVSNFNLDGRLIEEAYLPLETGAIVLDSAGNAWVGGCTHSDDLAPPESAAGYRGNADGYVAKLSSDGSALLALAYVGGSADDLVRGLVLQNDQNILVTGSTSFTENAPHFPITPRAFQTQYGGNISDAFVVRVTEAAPAPPNDAFAQRTPLTGAFLSVQGINLPASKEAGEPAHAGDAGGKSLWWSWTAPSAGHLVVSTSGSRFDTLLAVYRGDTLATLQQLATNDVFAADQAFSRIVLPVQGGATYQIMVDGKGGAAGEILLHLAYSRPANDDFAQSIPLSGMPASTNGSNIDATREPGESWHGYYGRHSVWWSWKAASTGDVVIDTAGSDFDTLLAVYTNAPTGEFQVMSNDDFGTNQTSHVGFRAVKDTTYYLAVDGAFDATGRVQLNLLPGAPPVNDNFAAAIPLTGWSTNLTSSNLNATREPGEPELVYTNAFGPYSNSANQTAWWSWTAPTNGYLTLHTDGSNFDTRLGVFTGSVLTNLTAVASNDDWANGFTSRVIFQVLSNVTYFVQVEGSRYGAPGIIRLSLRFSVPPVILLPSLAQRPDGSFTFSARGLVGQRYQIQSSTNLTSWTQWSGDPFLGETFSVTDPASATFPRRFYRLVEAP